MQRGTDGAARRARRLLASPRVLQWPASGRIAPRPSLLNASSSQRASHAARCVACHGVRSHPVPVALVGECSIPVV
jgi:cytochrome c553